jgi:hypothetical protein
MQRRSCFITYNDRKITSKRKKSPRVESLIDAIFGPSSPKEEEVEAKSVEASKYSGFEKGARKAKRCSKARKVGHARSSGKEMDEEIDFFVRHIAGGDLNEEDASKRKEQAKAIGYNSRAMIFGGGKDVLVCIPKAREAKIVKNVARSIGFLEIEMTLSKLRKRKLSQSFTYTNIKVKTFPLSCNFNKDMNN